ncbi:unnamed protein product [Aphanomyces euteiches]
MNGLGTDGSPNETEMEGNLHVRAKNMNVWKKRRFVLSGSILQYFSLKKTQKGMLGNFSALGLKKKEDHIFELVQCSIKTVHEYLSSRQYSFQIASASFFLLLHAESHAEMLEWVTRLQQAAQNSTIHRNLRRTNSSHLLSPSSAMIKVVAQSQEDDIHDFSVAHRPTIHTIVSVCRQAGDYLIVQRPISVEGKQLSRGSILIAVNGNSAQRFHHDQPLPATLQFLRCQRKSGVLKSQSYEALGQMLKITTRGTAIMGWKDLTCEIDGDLFECVRQPVTSSKWGQSLLQESTKTSLSLAGASVRLVHEVLSGRPFCFLLSNPSSSLLLQAASDDDLVDWMGALVHAIDLANGVVVGGGVSQSPMMSAATSSSLATTFFPQNGIQRNLHARQDSIFGPSKPSTSAQLSASELVDMLCFCQREGRYTEALQMLTQYTGSRALYWPHIFGWALPQPSTQNQIAALAMQRISDEDVTQLQKDVPRTASWLAGSEGAPPSTVQASSERLAALQTVLHAFIASNSTSTSYLQGMNGIAFVLLEVFSDDVACVFRFLHGVVHGILPTIFETQVDAASNALVQTGVQLESMVVSYLPALSLVFEQVGLPVFLLAYKWFPTLFSDVSLQANRRHNQLKYVTLLVAWDVCMLLGIEGIYCVALALFAASDHAIRALPSPCLAEDVSSAFTNVLAQLTPQELVLHVCEVVETCQHPLLLQMRDSHHRNLHVVKVKNLDTGQVFGVGANAKLVPLEDI